MWQYVKVPVTWTDSGSDSQTMGVTGYVMSGGTTYDHRSSPFGDLASYYEWDSLDPSFGHSDEAKQYHYHAVSMYLKIYFYCPVLISTKLTKFFLEF